MPRTIYLRDGTAVNNVPDDVTQEQINQKEDQHFMGRAAKEGALTVGDKIYSGSAVYPNSYTGHALAFLDTYAGGNLLAKGVRAADEASGGRVRDTAEALGQGMTLGAGTIPDLVTHAPAWVTNQFREKVLGQPGDVPYPPSVTEAMRQAIGVPDLAPDAPWYRKAAEGAIAGATGGGIVRGALTAAPMVADAIYGGTSALTSMIGEKLGGPVGRTIGAVAPFVAGPYALKMGARSWGATRPPEAPPLPEVETPNWQSTEPTQPFYHPDAPTSQPVSAAPSGPAGPPGKTIGEKLGDLAWRFGMGHYWTGSPVAGIVNAAAPWAIDTTRGLVANSPRIGRFAYSPTSLDNWPAVAPQVASQVDEQPPPGLVVPVTPANPYAAQQ
jgi:hypothetical protein